jgi:dihydroorotate dehydrogenase
MRKATQFLYIYLLKPILFLFPADSVHTFFLRTGHTLGKYSFFKKIFKSLWAYEDKSLEQNICGLDFKNPIGLSAGFDYDGELVEILPSIGFGFNTVGTVTYEPYGGNPAPMLARLPKSRALLVNKGFKNSGIKNVLSGFKDDKSTAPRGVSIGSTNKPYANFQEMLTGYREWFS